MAQPYDPVQRHLYYERTKRLKGRRPGSGRLPSPVDRVGTTPIRRIKERTAKPTTKKELKAKAQARVVRLTQKLNRLQDALKEAHEALREQKKAARESRNADKKEEKKNSDDKTTAKERAAAERYRNKNKAELKNKAKKAADSSQKKTVSEMSEAELGDRITKITKLISSAKEQIKKANAQANSL
jgi:hypothetical protein